MIRTFLQSNAFRVVEAGGAGGNLIAALPEAGDHCLILLRRIQMSDKIILREMLAYAQIVQTTNPSTFLAS